MEQRFLPGSKIPWCHLRGASVRCAFMPQSEFSDLRYGRNPFPNQTCLLAVPRNDGLSSQTLTVLGPVLSLTAPVVSANRPLPPSHPRPQGAAESGCCAAKYSVVKDSRSLLCKQNSYTLNKRKSNLQRKKEYFSLLTKSEGTKQTT